jgi:hypothetical protein
MKNKTILEWLHEIMCLDIRGRAIKAFHSLDGIEYRKKIGIPDHQIENSFHEAINMAFEWNKTPEGETFWSLVATSYQKGVIPDIRSIIVSKDEFDGNPVFTDHQIMELGRTSPLLDKYKTEHIATSKQIQKAKDILSKYLTE